MQLSRYFTLSDLTITSTGLDNSPDGSALSNLTGLANLLDKIYETIGPFNINSGYRSPLVNQIIGGTSGSLHMQGKAADLMPLTMSPESFFTKLANSGVLKSTGEIINESERGIVHVSTPTSTMQGVLKYLEGGEYFRYTAEQAKKLLALGKENPITSAIIISVISGGILYFLMRKK